MAKGYLPISPVTPLKLQEILGLVKEALIKTNPEYDIVIKRLHLYYDIKFVTFGIDIKKPYYTFPNFHSALHTTTINTISIRNSSSSNHS